VVELGAAAAILAGAALQSATGFGFALLASPLLFALLDPKPAVATLALVGSVLNAVTLAGERRRPQVLRADALAIIAGTIPGLLCGALILRVAPASVLTAAVAGCVLVALATRLRRPRATPRRLGDRPWAAPVAGFASGSLSTSTGLSGPPLVLHLLARRVPAARMRDTLAAVFLAQGILGLGALVVAGSFVWPRSLPLLLVVGVVGQVAGRRAFAALGGERYERVVVGLLVVTAIVALVAALT
jgi:uncharacterized protein